jgi:hypothetical protein
MVPGKELSIMSNLEQPLLCQCANTRIVWITAKSSKRPVFVVELISPEGEIFTKFFNVNMTPKGNYSVHHNSDLAKLYRLVTGTNPQKRLSRCDQLLKHLVGHYFFIRYELADCKSAGNYMRVKSIKPEFSIIGDNWTVTGHLTKNVRINQGEKSAKSRRIIGENLAKNKRKVGDCNSHLAHARQGLEYVFNPTLNTPYQDSNTLHSTVDSIEGNNKSLRPYPPDTPCLESVIEHKQNFLH